MWENKNIWLTEGTSRYSGVIQKGVQGDHVSPTAYHREGGSFLPYVVLPNGSHFSVDVPNLPSLAFLKANTFSPFPGAVNRAWSKMVQDIRKHPASLGVALAEWPESLGMVTKRLMQMYRAYDNLRRGEFRRFVQTLNIPIKRKHRHWTRTRANQASGLWLEYSFGWKPLTQDVYAGIHALGSPLPGGPVHGSTRTVYYQRNETKDIIDEMRYKVIVRQGCDAFVVNPNTFALQQLGLANPLEIAWELVPFSFMVDWVFDVGTSLAGLTDLLGLQVQNPYRTIFAKGRGEHTLKWNRDPTLLYRNVGTAHLLERKLGLSRPTPNLDFRANIGQSLNRAANAASLLGQILTK